MKTLCRALGLGLCLLLVSNARADGQVDEAQARVLFKEGIALLTSGDFASALERFEKAYEHWRNPKILLNIATTLRQLGRLPEAADTYELYLADPGADPAKAEEVKQALSEIDGKLGRLVIEVGMDAVVSVDGKELQRTKTPTTKHLVRTLLLEEKKKGRWRVRLEPGDHRIEVVAQGYTPRVEELFLAAGEEKVVEVRLEAIRAQEQEPEVAEPEVEETLSHDGQVSLIGRADVDGKFRGAVGAFGVGYGLGSVVELQAVGLIGTDKGAEVGATLYLSEGMFKPLGYVGVPVFFVDGPNPGVHGAVGLQVDPTKNFGAFLQVGVAAFFGAPEDRESTAFVPSIGVQGRL